MRTFTFTLSWKLMNILSIFVTCFSVKIIYFKFLYCCCFWIVSKYRKGGKRLSCDVLSTNDNGLLAYLGAAIFWQFCHIPWPRVAAHDPVCTRTPIFAKTNQLVLILNNYFYVVRVVLASAVRHFRRFHRGFQCRCEGILVEKVTVLWSFNRRRFRRF